MTDFITHPKEPVMIDANPTKLANFKVFMHRRQFLKRHVWQKAKKRGLLNEA